VAVIVAPVLRFMEVGYNANVVIADIGLPDKIINGFAPELFGRPLEEGDVLSTTVVDHDGLQYYQW
jgi:hypothetical protein